MGIMFTNKLSKMVAESENLLLLRRSYRKDPAGREKKTWVGVTRNFISSHSEVRATSYTTL